MKTVLLCLLSLVLAGFTTFILSSAQTDNTRIKQAVADKNLTEEEKVAHLINYVRTLDGAIFIRNGKEFKPADAAEHLQSKWEKHKKRVKTAQGFVTKLASVSKTDEPYQIRFSDGKTVKCSELLTKELSRIEG